MSKQSDWGGPCDSRHKWLADIVLRLVHTCAMGLVDDEAVRAVGFRRGYEDDGPSKAPAEVLRRDEERAGLHVQLLGSTG